MSRAKRAPSASSVEPQPVPRPAWVNELPEVVDVQSSLILPSQLGGMVLHLPPMQRPIVWTPAQQLALVEGLWRGLPVAPVIVWEDRRHGRLWLLDGQQRMTAIGADVRDHTGERRPIPPTRWDWRTGAWSLDVGEPMTLASLADWRTLEALFDADADREHRAAVACGADRAHRIPLPMIVIGGWRDVEPRRVVEAFGALATPGVPWAEDEITAMVRACAEWTP